MPATRAPGPRNRLLSEIEEEEEKSQHSRTDHRGERRQGAGEKERTHKRSLSRNKAEGRSLKVPEAKHKNGGSGEAPIRRARSGENLIQMEKDQRPESPSRAAKRGSKASPRTARKNVIRELQRLASEDQEGIGEKPVLSTQKEELESSLDHVTQNMEDRLQVLLVPHDDPLSCDSPLEDILRGMEDET